MDAIATTSIHIAHCIAVNTIRQANIGVCEQLFVLQSLAIRSDIVAIDG